MMVSKRAALLIAFLSLCATPALTADAKNVVIVHGAFADGSGWRTVSDMLTAEGFTVTIVQQPLTSLADDIAATKRVLSLQDGATVLVGHSYGGMVVSEAGHDEKVSSLVYVAAFQPERGETVVGLNGSKPIPGADPDAIKATADDFLYLDQKAFAPAFAADLPKATTGFMSRSQVFAAKAAFTAPAGDPAWKSKRSWSIVAKRDKSINPELERYMAKRAGSHISEVDASHAVYAAKPDAVVAVIRKAAKQSK